MAKLCETIQVESPQVMCVERDVRNEHGRAPLMYKTQEACKYDKERDNATTCGNCSFGVKLLEPRQVHDTHGVLRQLM